MKKLRNSIVLVTLLATSSVMANNNHENSCKMEKKNHSTMKHKKDDRKDVRHFILRTVQSMDLSKTQMAELKKIKKNYKKSKFTGITVDGFDKKAYIAAKIQTKEQKIKEEAELIGSIYAILDKDQITYIGMKIKSMEKHRAMMQKRGSHME